MSYHLPDIKIPAPCIINKGVVVNKQDIRRLLADLGRVSYIYFQQGKVENEGEGDVMEVFSHPQRSTLVANNALYLNIYSFDYLELKQSSEQQTYFDLVQETMCLRLIPLSTPIQERRERFLNGNTIEVMMEQLFSAKWDAEMDDDSSDLF